MLRNIWDFKVMVAYQRNADGQLVDENGRKASYWDQRKELVYYHALANCVRLIGNDAQSLLDVGSAGCKYLEWFDWIPDRASLDLKYATKAKGVRSIIHDFLTWEPDRTYDIVTCSQVLEHVPDVEAFAKKLLACGRRVLISVPHKWKAGAVKGHIHDPVDQDKVDEWFGRKPDYSMTVREPFSAERLICFYNVEGAPLGLSQMEVVNRLVGRQLAKS